MEQDESWPTEVEDADIAVAGIRPVPQRSVVVFCSDVNERHGSECDEDEDALRIEMYREHGSPSEEWWNRASSKHFEVVSHSINEGPARFPCHSELATDTILLFYGSRSATAVLDLLPLLGCGVLYAELLLDMQTCKGPNLTSSSNPTSGLPLSASCRNQSNCFISLCHRK